MKEEYTEESKTEMRTMLIIILGAIISIAISMILPAVAAVGILFLSSAMA